MLAFARDSDVVQPPELALTSIQLPVIQHTGKPLLSRRIDEAGLTAQAVQCTLAFTKDPEADVRLAACRAAGSLVAAEAAGKLPGSQALRKLLCTFLALVGPGQTPLVQQQQMQASLKLLLIVIALLRDSLSTWRAATRLSGPCKKAAGLLYAPCGAETDPARAAAAADAGNIGERNLN